MLAPEAGLFAREYGRRVKAVKYDWHMGNEHGWVVFRRGGRWTPSIPNYRGINTMSWWPLNSEWWSPDFIGLKDRPSHTRAIIERLEGEMCAIPTGGICMCNDMSLVTDYTTACMKAGYDVSLLFVANYEIDDKRRVNLNRLGIDVAFPSGSYSFLDGDCANRDEPKIDQELVRFVDARVNECGLLRTLQDAREFMELHASKEEALGLEPLGDATPMVLYEVDGQE